MERLLTLYSEVQSTDVRWLWYPFIAIGKITLLQGDPGDGKSTMMMNLIAELSTGGNCDSSTAMQWREGNDVHSAFSARAFSGLVFQTLNWRMNCRYQCRGICRGQENAQFLLFELDESRILTRKNQYEQAENRSMNLECRLYRSKWIQSITARDVMESGQVVENPMIGTIPSRNEVQRELDDLLMSM